jgi:hypothetical protein
VLHHWVDLEALGESLSERHWLVTLGGCYLLDGLVLLHRALQKSCEEATKEIVRGIRLPRWSSKSHNSGIKV